MTVLYIFYIIFYQQWWFADCMKAVSEYAIFWKMQKHVELNRVYAT